MRNYDLDDDDDAIIRQLMKDRPIASMGNQRLGDKAPLPVVNDDTALFSVNEFASVAEATLASRPETSSFSYNKHLNPNNNINRDSNNPDDVTTEEQISASALAAAARIAKEKAMEKRLKETFGLATKEENLGTNFFLTPWIKPTFEKAEEFRRSQIFRGGETTDGNISLVSSPDLGLGVRLYFQFLISMCIGLAVMWFFALPMLAFTYSSSGMPPQGQEAAGLYRFSLGNLGYESPAAYNNFMSSPRLCTKEPFGSNGETCISVGGFEFSMGQIQVILAGCEFFQVLVWLGVSVYLSHRMQQLRRPDQAENLVSVTHYAVYVDNLPPLVTAEEVIAHFSQLYQLQHTDFRDRLPVEDSRPVQSVDHNGLQMHAGSWVAECTLYRRIGSLLRQFKAKEPLLKRLVRQRAEMKRFAQDTTHPLGHDTMRFEQAELRMLATARDVDAFFAQVRNQQRILATQFRMKRAATQYRHYLDTEKQQQKQLKNQQPATQETQSKPSSSSTFSSWFKFNFSFTLKNPTNPNKNKSNTPRISFQEPVEQSDIEKNLSDVQHNGVPIISEVNNNNSNQNDGNSDSNNNNTSRDNNSRPSSAVATLFNLSPRISEGNKLNNETILFGNHSRPTSSHNHSNNTSNNNIDSNNNNNRPSSSQINTSNNNSNNNNSNIVEVRPSSSNGIINNNIYNINKGISDVNKSGSSHSVTGAVQTVSTSVSAVSLTPIIEHDTLDLHPDTQTPRHTQKTLQDFLDVTSPVTIEDAEVVGAFVVFEYNESQARCMQDYSVFSTFPFSLVYPPQMLLQGRRLRVRKAPEPDQIIYENLEYSDVYKVFLQLRTACVATLLLLVCFSLVVFGASLRSAYSQRLPSQPLCAVAVPALYAPQFTLTPQTLQNMELKRPSVTPNAYHSNITNNYDNINGSSVATHQNDRDTLDNQCVAVLDSENAFFATYNTPSSSLGDTVSRYSFSACFSSSLLRLHHNVSRHNPHNLSDIFLQYHRDTFNNSVPDDYYDPDRNTNDVFQWTIAKQLLLMRHNVSYFNARFNQNIDTEQVARDTYSATNDFSCPRFSSDDILVPYVNTTKNSTNSEINHFIFNMSTVSFCPCVTLHTRQTCVLAPCQLGLVTVRHTSTSDTSSSIISNSTLSNATSATSSFSAVISTYEVESETHCAVAAASVAACYCATVSSKRAWFFTRDTQGTPSVAQLLISGFFSGDNGHDTPVSDHCADYETVLWSSRFVEYGLILVTVLVNRLLKMALVTLVSYEGHASVDEAQRSVLIKLFAATALNTGVVVLLAYGLRPPVTDTLLSKDDTAALSLSDKTNFSTDKWHLSRWLQRHAAGLSLGPYTDLTRDWFGSVGFYFLSTLTFTSLLPLLLPTLNWSILKPLQRHFVSWSLAGQKTFQFLAYRCLSLSQPVLQSDLDTLLLAQPFQFTAHAAQVLSIVTVACCYATGLPLLPLLALLLAFFFLRLDTFLLLRVSIRPPALDHRVLHTLFSLLYLSVALRLVLGIWAFSNPDILDPADFWVVDTVSTHNPSGNTQGGVQGGTTQSGTSQLSDTMSLRNYATQLQLLRDTLRHALQNSATLAEALSLSTLRHIPDTVVATLRYVLVSRCLQPVSFPLFLFLVCLCVAWVAQHLLWRHLLYPFRFLWRRLRFLFNFLNLKKKKVDTFSAAREKGYVHPFELLLSSSVGDEVEAVANDHRCEAAPFTGIYYQFVQRKTLENNNSNANNADKNIDNNDKKSCLFCLSRLLCPKCCCRKRNKNSNKYALDMADTHSTSAKLRALGDTGDTPAHSDNRNFKLKLTSVFLSGGGRGRALLKPQEVFDGWQTAEMGLEFVVKVCTWQTSVFKNETDAQTHVKGQHKRTFEVLQQYRGAAAATYRLDRHPLYSLPYLALRDTEGHITTSNNNNNYSTSVITSLAEDYLQKMDNFPLRAKKTFNPSKEEQKLWRFLVKRWLHKSEGVVPGSGEGLTEEEENEDDDILILEKKLKKIRETHENEEKLRKENEEEEAIQKELLREMYGTSVTGVSRRNQQKVKRSSDSSEDEESDDSSDEESDDSSDEETESDDESEETESNDKEIAVRGQRRKTKNVNLSGMKKRREEAKSLTSISSSGSETDDGDEEEGSSETENDSDDSEEEDSGENESSGDDDDDDEEEEEEESSSEENEVHEKSQEIIDIEIGKA